MAIRNSLKLLFIFFLPLQSAAQEPDITGLWKGFMYNDTTQQNLRYEIAISEENGKFYGYSHQYFIVGDKEFHGVKKLKIKRDGNEITTEEVDLIVHNYPTPPAKGVHQLNTLTLEIKGDIMILSGGYKTNRTRDFRPLTGYVHVERTNDFKQSALVPHLQELNLAKNLTFLKEENAKEEDFVLKPVASDEDVQSIVIAAQKKQPLSTSIKPSATPEVKIPEVAAVKDPEAKKETVQPEVIQPPVVIKETPKTVEPAVVKQAAPKEIKPQPGTVKETPKTVEPAVVKQAAPKEIKPQPVTVKETPKTVEPAVVKQATAKEIKPQPVTVKETPKTVEPAVVKQVPPATKPAVTAAPVKKPDPVSTKPAEQPVVKTVVPPPAPLPKPAAPKPQPVVVDPTAAADLANRKVETIKALYFKSDSLTLTLYDNGEVDGDTVSVVMNGGVIMPKVGLSTNAVKKTIYTNEIAGDSIQLVMYAESLGSLPPNTGLLIVNDGNDRYEIRFSGDMQKSSAIVFRRRK